jgi:crotonobetainyl-CoA:carnitine CoA-transferase CaiB-like acyl-CoA transferase
MPEGPAGGEATELPLTGLLVVELGHSVAAPYAGLVLGELGAAVIKIEKPGKGDDARGWGPPFLDGAAAVFHALNRNKRSVIADLRDAKDLAALKALIGRADVVIQNLRPGQVHELGLGPKAMIAANPKLIYASIGAFGATGPLKDQPGYDPLMQAMGGVMSVTGEPGRPPVRVGTSLIDMGAGGWVVTGVLSALVRRGVTGRGGEVFTSLYETALQWMLYHVASHAADGKEPGRHGSGAATIVPYQAFETADGYLVVGAGNDNLFRKLAPVVGMPELVDDPRYVTNAARVENRASLIETLAAEFRTRARADWIERLRAAGVPCAPVQDVRELHAHPQTQALGILRGEDDPRKLRTIGLPLLFDGVRPARDDPAPAHGEATQEFLGHQPTAAAEAAG